MQPNRSEREQIIFQFDRRFSAGGIRHQRLNRLLQSNSWIVWVQILTGAKRALDFILAVALLFIFSPLIAVLATRGFAKTERLGRWGRIFNRIEFRSGPFRTLPALINVAKGDLSLIGPRAVSPGQVSASDRAAWRRFSVRPGLVCLWWIRQRANIAYGSESEVDSEYLDSQSLLGDLAIALRAIPAAFYGDAFNGTGLAMAHDRIHLLEIPIDNLTMEEAVDLILVRARGTVPAQLCFVNADCINIARRDSDYKRLLQTASIVLADGIGVKLAGRILNNNVRQNVNGTDLFPVLCRALEGQNAGQNAGIYLLGGKPGVVEEVVAWIRKNYPRVTVKGHRHGYFSVADESPVLGAIRDSGAEILLVAFGAPKQEKWIRGHLEETGARIAIGVGGLFDFYSGRVTRAPVWVREIGMEWLYRFVQEPRRMWRRYFVGNFVFLCRVLSRRFLAGAAE